MASRARFKKDEVFDIRVGDVWVFQTNWSGIQRTITGLDDPAIKGARIYYRGFGEYIESSCLRSTFRRWWRCAGLDSATDWEGRDNQGRTFKTPPDGAKGER